MILLLRGSATSWESQEVAERHLEVSPSFPPESLVRFAGTVENLDGRALAPLSDESRIVRLWQHSLKIFATSANIPMDSRFNYDLTEEMVPPRNTYGSQKQAHRAGNWK
jgi:hypothetical protein